MPISNMLHATYTGDLLPALQGKTAVIKAYDPKANWAIGPVVLAQFDDQSLLRFAYLWHPFLMDSWEIDPVYRVGTPEHTSWLEDHERWVAFVAAEADQPVEA